MSQPTPSDAHVNTPLTQISIAFLQERDEFIADKVFPNIPVTKQSDRYYVYTKDQWFRSDAKKRAPGTETAGSGFELDNTPTYFADPIGVHKDIDDQLRANADAVINPDRDATEFVTQQLLVRRERDWAAKYFTTSVWTGSTTGGDITPGTLWDAGGSTPIEDIRDQIRSVKKKTGIRPNTLVVSEEVWDVLIDHPEFLDRIKGGATRPNPALVMAELLAQVLRLERVLIGGAVENTAAEKATLAMDFIMGKNALVVYANPRPSLLKPSGGYTFSWQSYLGAAGPQGQVISRFRMQHLRADRVEGEMAYDQKLVAAELGAFFSNPIS